VLRRFYRSEKTRHTSGLGLGLNLVTAIVKLHGFRFTIVPGPGCVVEIACPYALNGGSSDERQRGTEQKPSGWTDHVPGNTKRGRVAGGDVIRNPLRLEPSQ
jgi:hypothetical protein